MMIGIIAWIPARISHHLGEAPAGDRGTYQVRLEATPAARFRLQDHVLVKTPGQSESCRGKRTSSVLMARCKHRAKHTLAFRPLRRRGLFYFSCKAYKMCTNNQLPAIVPTTLVIASSNHGCLRRPTDSSINQRLWVMWAVLSSAPPCGMSVI